MTNGFITSTGRHTLGSYTAVSRAYEKGGETLYAYYLNELSVYVGNVWDETRNAWVADGISAAGATYVCVGGENGYSSATSKTVALTIRAVQFAAVTTAASGAGSLARSSGTIYGGRYAIVGDSITFTATPSSGYLISRIDATVSGAVIATSSTTTLSFIPTEDTAILAYFAPAAYKLSRVLTTQGVVRYFKTTSGGSSEVEITDDFAADGTQSVSAGDIIRVSVTAMGAYTFAYLRIDDERRYATTTDATQSFSFTIAARTSDAIYDTQAVFEAKANYTNAISLVNGTLGSVAVTDSSGSSVTITDGTFQARHSETYKLTATVTDSNANMFDGWFSSDGTRLSDAEVLSYTFTQTTAQRSFVARFSARTTVPVAFYTGTSATTYGPEESAYIAGCRVTATAHPTAIGDKYLSGVWTFRPTAPTGWAFVSLYIEDLDVTGGTNVYTADADGNVKVNITFAARVIALFRNTATPVTPADVDQGNATKATGENAKGIWAWKQGGTNKTAIWRSKRFVGTIPMNWAAACVYADAYPVAMRVDGFQSPDATDGSPRTLSAKSQSGFRIPLRRAEKYTEVEIKTSATVTHAAISTAMTGLAGGTR